MDHVKKHVHGGKVANYIPQLAKVDPEIMAVAVCSVDGQFFSKGDDEHRFCIQSCVKPFTYLMALEELGLDYVHKHVGREPSGKAFNAFSLTDAGLPHNPMINSGAIAVCGLLGREQSAADRFESLQNKFSTMVRGANVRNTTDGLEGSGGGLRDRVLENTGGVDPRSFHCGFDNATYMSERDTGFNNYALAHFMRASSHGHLSPTQVTATIFFFLGGGLYACVSVCLYACVSISMRVYIYGCVCLYACVSPI
jgi:glutaminase